MICFAILAHENEELLLAQIANIRSHAPGNMIVVFNGGEDPSFGTEAGVPICPYSRPMRHGNLGYFLPWTMKWLCTEGWDFDYLVSMDSDVALVHDGFEAYILEQMNEADCMGINMGLQRSVAEVPHWYPGQTLWREWSKWQPFFQCDAFCGTLNIMQVYRYLTVRQIVAHLDFVALEQRLESTEVFAIEEMLCPTLAWRDGARIKAYPTETARYVRLGEPWSHNEIAEARAASDVYFIHPAPADANSIAYQPPSGGPSHEYPSSLTVIWGCYQGGVETAIRERLTALATHGFEAHAYFYHGGAGESNFVGIPHHIGQTTTELLQYVADHHFSVVTFVNTLWNLDQLFAAGYAGTCLFEIHGYEPAIIKELNKINTGQDKGMVSAVIVPGLHVAAIAHAALWRRPDLPVLVARNTLDTTRFQARDPARFAQENRVHRWRNQPLIGWVGRLDDNKNWRSLLDIFGRLRKKGLNLKLLIASDLTHSPDLKEFSQQVHRLGFDSVVQILGNIAQDEMPFYYSLVSLSGGILLSTSRAEGYPYHLLEAQSCGCPIVSAYAGGTAEIVAHGVTGYLFRQGHEREAAHYARKLLGNATHRQQFAVLGRERVQAVNSPDQAIGVYEDILRNLSLRSGSSRCI